MSGDIFLTLIFPGPHSMLSYECTKNYMPISLKEMNNYHTPGPHSMLCNENYRFFRILRQIFGAEVVHL